MVKQPDSSHRISRRGVRFAALVLVGIPVGLAGVARGQVFTEFPIPTADSRPAGITAGPDGALWFIESASKKIGRITTAGVVTEYAIPASTYPGGLSAVVNTYPHVIAAGADGNLWFPHSVSLGLYSYFSSEIGRITTTGVITEFSAFPTLRSQPEAIAAGPDGNLWFTQTTPGTCSGCAVMKIGRITTDGVVTEFAVPSGLGQSFGIAAGPDGNVWFTEILQTIVLSAPSSEQRLNAAFYIPSGKIGRISPSGVVTEFPIPNVDNRPYSIAAGPDGNLWFTETVPELSGDISLRIGRITTAGLITEFSVRTGVGYRFGPFEITAGPDGNLWFLDSGNRIGRITTAGVVTEFTLPAADSGAAGITAGPDGNLWFTESNTNKIGRLNLSATACTPSDTNLCLNDARFKVEATWTTGDGATGSGRAVALTADSGYFWFFSPNSPEVMVKAVNACSFNSRQWLFAAGLTNVNVVLKVTDTQTGQVKTYVNPQGTAFAPIQDTSAFACP
jgi:streptogramin lyase